MVVLMIKIIFLTIMVLAIIDTIRLRNKAKKNVSHETKKKRFLYDTKKLVKLINNKPENNFLFDKDFKHAFDQIPECVYIPKDKAEKYLGIKSTINEKRYKNLKGIITDFHIGIPMSKN